MSDFNSLCAAVTADPPMDPATFLTHCAMAGEREPELLLAGLQSTNQDVRMHAVFGFSARRDVTHLHKVLDDPWFVVRQLAVEAFAEFGDETAVPILEAALNDPKNREVGALLDAAIEGIHRLTGRTAEAPKLPEPTKNKSARRTAPKPVTQRHRIASPLKHEILTEIDRLASYETQEDATKRLSEIGEPALDFVLGVLDGTTSYKADGGYGEWRDAADGISGAVSAMAEACPTAYLEYAKLEDARGNSWLTHWEFVAGLGNVPMHEAVPPLLQALRSRDDWVRHSAAQALAWRDEEALLGTFEKMLRHTDPSVRCHGAEGLERIGDSQHLAMIRRAANLKRNRELPLVHQWLTEAADRMEKRLNGKPDA